MVRIDVSEEKNINKTQNSFKFNFNLWKKKSKIENMKEGSNERIGRL